MFTSSSNIRFRTLALTKTLVPVLSLVFAWLAWTSLAWKSDSMAMPSNFADQTEQLYRVNWATTSRMNVQHRERYTPFQLAPTLRTALPHIENIARVQLFGKGFLQGKDQLSSRVNDIVFAERELLDIFEFKAMKGNLNHTLSQPNQVALSESTARQLFGTTDVIGQTIQLNRHLTLEVTSIFKDHPSHAYASANVLISFASLNSEVLNGFPMDSWTDTRKVETYLVLAKEQTPLSIHQELQQIARTYLPKTTKLGAENTLILQAFKDFYKTPMTLLNI